ncbi:flagellar filament capping protein FliD [bacterium]|nr:flagellar filament capping protein FliD [bacterium]
MSISFSGLASGLDTSGWVDALVSVKQEKVSALSTELKTLKASKNTFVETRSVFNDLRTAIEKLTDVKFGGAFDLFGQNIAKSSDESIFTATASGSALRQSFDIMVQQLATYTKATSKESASAIADDETLLSNLGVSEGKLTVFVNGTKTEINIEKDDTLLDFKSQLAGVGIQTELDENGVIKFSAKNEGDTINIGATTDDTNFVSLFGLSKQEDGTYASTNSLFKANISSKLTADNSGFNEKITTGTFTIGNAQFTIDENTTLSSLISKINNNEEAQATAYWDDTTGKLTITSKKEGASYINIEAGTSNFTDVMQLTTTERDDDGNVVSSKMFTETQELGKNAMLTINGTSITATSNTISSDISRIEGVTINLKGVTSADEDGNVKSAKLDVNQDISGLTDAIKGFVEAYNSMMSKVDEVTASGAALHNETSLTSLQSTLRNYANGSNTANGGAFKLLSQIGITTVKADSNNLSANTSTLSFDESAFKKAMEEDADSVRSILAEENGILSMMENTVEMSLKATVGFFDIKQSTYDSDIKNMEEKIKKQNTKIETYRAQLQDKFSNMELMISQMQQNYSSFLAG